MPKITSVEPQKRNLRCFNIYLDDKFAFGVDEDLVVEYRLVTGKILDASLVEKLLFEVEVGKLMERMYGLFNIRQRSEKEIRDYLKNLSFKRKVKNQEEIFDAAIELLINKLKQKKLLDDEEFAKAWIEARRRSKKKGKIALKQELYQKGIDKNLIDKMLEKTTSESETQLAEQALIKRWPRWENLVLVEKKKKAYEFLMRRGFEYEIVREVIEKVLKKG